MRAPPLQALLRFAPRRLALLLVAQRRVRCQQCPCLARSCAAAALTFLLAHSLFAALGVRVTVVDERPRLLTFVDYEVIDTLVKGPNFEEFNDNRYIPEAIATLLIETADDIEELKLAGGGFLYRGL